MLREGHCVISAWSRKFEFRGDRAEGLCRVKPAPPKSHPLRLQPLSRWACATVLAVFLLTPEAFWSGLPSVCIFRNQFGLECLGCGMTRALAAASHGRFAAALASNAGIVMLLPLLVFGSFGGLRLPR